jgi:hypothetical protein
MSGESLITVKEAYTLSGREDPQLVVAIQKLYEWNTSPSHAHTLSNACVHDGLPRGFVVAVPFSAPVTREGVMDKDFCGCVGVFKINAHNDNIRHWVGDPKKLAEELEAATPLSTHANKPLMDVNDERAVRVWTATLATDSRDTRVDICEGVRRIGPRTEPFFSLIVRTNLKQAVKTLLRKYRKDDAMSVGSFLNSTDYARLKKYTAINLCRLAHTISNTLALRCTPVSEDMVGGHKDYYGDACDPELPLLFYNVLEDGNERDKIAWMLDHVYHIEPPFNGGLVVERPPGLGFLVARPANGAHYKGVSPVRGLYVAPMDMGLIPVGRRGGPGGGAYTAEGIGGRVSAYGQSWPIHLLEKMQGDIDEKAYEKFLEFNMLLEVNGIHRTDHDMRVGIISTMEDRHTPLPFVEGDVVGGNVQVPMDHLFVHFLIKRYAKASKNKGLPVPKFKLQDAFGHSSRKGYFGIEKSLFARCKALVLTKPKYARKLGYECP